jgi:TetR/AcrR family transcriptional regulator, transcriptional repressor for nem operon
MVRYPSEETAEKHRRILDQASKLFREHGLAGVSVNDLMTASDLTHGAFYNHFDSKQALYAECITHVSEVALAQIESCKPAEAGKRTFAASYASIAMRDDPGAACLMPSLGAEIGREPAAKPAMTRYVAAFLGKIASHFPWPSRPEARRGAIRMTASLVGAMVLARAVDDDALSREILRDVISGIDART